MLFYIYLYFRWGSFGGLFYSIVSTNLVIIYYIIGIQLGQTIYERDKVMKNQNILLLALAGSLSLVACNSGSSSTPAPAPADVQQGATVSSGTTNGYAIAYYANNCRVISSGQTCQVGLGYLASGSYIGQSVSLQLPSGYSTTTSCPAMAAESTSCLVTITASSSANTSVANKVNVLLNNQTITTTNVNNESTTFGFAIGGGIPSSSTSSN